MARKNPRSRIKQHGGQRASLARSPANRSRDDDERTSLEHGSKAAEIYAEYQEYFAGPLPHPQILSQYNEISPGSADKIIDTFVAQSQHRMGLEKTVIEGNSKRAYLGVISAFILSIAAFYIAYALVASGHATQAAVIVTLDLAALAGVFVYGTNSRRTERVKKTEIIERQR